MYFMRADCGCIRGIFWKLNECLAAWGGFLRRLELFLSHVDKYGSIR